MKLVDHQNSSLKLKYQNIKITLKSTLQIKRVLMTIIMMVMVLLLLLYLLFLNHFHKVNVYCHLFVTV